MKIRGVADVAAVAAATRAPRAEIAGLPGFAQSAACLRLLASPSIRQQSSAGSWTDPRLPAMSGRDKKKCFHAGLWPQGRLLTLACGPRRPEPRSWPSCSGSGFGSGFRFTLKGPGAS